MPSSPPAASMAELTARYGPLIPHAKMQKYLKAAVAAKPMSVSAKATAAANSSSANTDIHFLNKHHTYLTEEQLEAMYEEQAAANIAEMKKLAKTPRHKTRKHKKKKSKSSSKGNK